MYRFLLKPKWLAFTLTVAAASVAMVNLGFWQLNRLDVRREFNALVELRSSLPAQAPSADWLGPDGNVDAAEWRAVIVTGSYERRTDTLAVSGGYQLLSMFTIDAGQPILVNRGGIDVSAEIPPPPEGQVTLEARVRRIPLALRRTNAIDGTYLEATRSAPEDGGVSALDLPQLDEGSHLSYALQWFTFSVCVVIGWVLAVRRSVTHPNHSPVRSRSKHQAIPWRETEA